MKNKAILITGGAGLIGSKLAKWVQTNTDYSAIVLDDLSGGYLENIHSVGNFILRDAGADLSDIFENNQIDYVFHLAAYAAEGLSPFIRKFNYQNNLVATANVINYCIKYDVKRLVFASSMAVYGSQKVPFIEGMIPAPIDPYGVAKLACEMDIRIAGEQHGLDWCIIRPHNVYGPNQNIWDRYRNVLGIWMRQYMNGENLTIFGDGTQKRAFSFIDDSLEAIWLCATTFQASREIFNIGSDTACTINEAAEILIGIMGGGKTEYHEARHEVWNAHSHHGKIKSLLGFTEGTSLESGLLQMWEWAKVQPVREIKTWKNLELDKSFIKLWQK